MFDGPVDEPEPHPTRVMQWIFLASLQWFYSGIEDPRPVVNDPDRRCKSAVRVHFDGEGWRVAIVVGEDVGNEFVNGVAEHVVGLHPRCVRDVDINGYAIGEFVVLGSFFGTNGTTLVRLRKKGKTDGIEHRITWAKTTRNADVKFDPRDGILLPDPGKERAER